jgi:hypothetical protein
LSAEQSRHQWAEVQILEALRDKTEVADGLQQRVHAQVAEAERRDAPITKDDRLLESLKPRGFEAAGVVQAFGVEQAGVDLFADAAQVPER